MRIFIENPGKSFTDQKHEKIDPFAYNNIIQAASVLFWTFSWFNVKANLLKQKREATPPLMIRC